MNILGLTPARRSSVRVPGKNTMLLDGVPILHYTAAAARNSRITHLLAVSNDPLFLRQAAEVGALTLVEPDDLATATSRISEVLDWATTCFEQEHGPVESVVLLQPNCPQRPPGLIDELLDCLEAGFDVTASVARIPLKHHPYFAGRQNSQGAFAMFHPAELRSMLSGDFPPRVFRLRSGLGLPARVATGESSVV